MNWIARVYSWLYSRFAAVAALHFAKFDARKRPHNVLCKEPTPNISADDSRGL